MLVEVLDLEIDLLEKLRESFGYCAEELSKRYKGTKIKVLTKKELEAMKILRVAFSNELRTQIVYLLSQEELPVCTLVATLNKDQTLISHHLAQLKKMNIILENRQGKFRFYRLNKSFLKEALEAISKILSL